jgi:hypothetical protein
MKDDLKKGKTTYKKMKDASKKNEKWKQPTKREKKEDDFKK